MEFEYDINKSKSNFIKHGIDFEKAQLLWDDINRLEIPAKTLDDVIIGMIADKHWTAVITYRRSQVRIIFVRRSRKNEEELYESW